MFNVLLHIMENYQTPDNCPTVDILYKHLSDAGFCDDEIDDAMDWLMLLTETCEQATDFNHPQSIRAFTDREFRHIGVEGIHYLQSLDLQGALPPYVREVVVNYCMAINSEFLNLSSMKVLTLLVLWNQNFPVDKHVIQELLATESVIQYN
ncbi:DUF494 family protein [Taylorella equigenitalis]|uniref:Protein Smg homolog n=2 Tax=Taylorella equigenitalis TaxID=29575 RepID=A0A654KGK9_TAYEM|nr:DUF494 domain-containing protein [Taylorella equigenitalis]ADU91583.1 Protein of unknown function Smg [Taylorella equigenitalis MCE9]ASY29820.1 Smg-like protein [Taylorella equigenitalis]ASY37123.1 DUF494 domain-containing protein [Taylorella equigenitalis]ASY40113.1 Smg-like protein [Taylorella equigenitalis]ASY41548.1 Smg-like protein [Taylorella equigenitalis]